MVDKYLFPGPEWSRAYCRALTESEEYRSAGRNWRHGTVMLVVRDLPASIRERYNAESIGMLLDLHEGVCRSVEWKKDPDPAIASYTITGSYKTWLEIIRGRIHPTTALMTRKLKLEKGDIGTILKFARASIAMVNVAKIVPTEFPE